MIFSKQVIEVLQVVPHEFFDQTGEVRAIVRQHTSLPPIEVLS